MTCNHIPAASTGNSFIQLHRKLYTCVYNGIGRIWIICFVFVDTNTKPRIQTPTPSHKKTKPRIQTPMASTKTKQLLLFQIMMHGCPATNPQAINSTLADQLQSTPITILILTPSLDASRRQESSPAIHKIMNNDIPNICPCLLLQPALWRMTGAKMADRNCGTAFGEIYLERYWM